MADSPWSDLERPPLRQPALAAALSGEYGVWRAIEVVAQTGSTNTDLRERARAGESEGLVLLAEDQTAGRGRLGRQWITPARAALAVSVLLRPQVSSQRLGWIPLVAGVAMTDALSQTCGLRVGLKWPNDVLVRSSNQQPAGSDAPAGHERKVCGVLAEVVDAAVIVGAGLNVSQDASELPVPTATSLRLAGAATTDRDTVARAYLRALASRYRDFTSTDGDPQRSGIGPAYRERCLTLGREVAVHLPGGGSTQRTVYGSAREIDDQGHLVVRTTSGELLTFAAGEVEHLRQSDL